MSKKPEFKILTIEELALDAFQKSEYVKALATMNTPTDYEERKKAFISLALAKQAANEAQAKLNIALN